MSSRSTKGTWQDAFVPAVQYSPVLHCTLSTVHGSLAFHHVAGNTYVERALGCTVHYISSFYFVHSHTLKILTGLSIPVPWRLYINIAQDNSPLFPHTRALSQSIPTSTSPPLTSSLAQLSDLQCLPQRVLPSLSIRHALVPVQ